MWLLIVEALLALGMLVFIVWWTMSSRRRPPAEADADDEAQAPEASVGALATNAEPLSQDPPPQDRSLQGTALKDGPAEGTPQRDPDNKPG